MSQTPRNQNIQPQTIQPTDPANCGSSVSNPLTSPQTAGSQPTDPQIGRNASPDLVETMVDTVLDEVFGEIERLLEHGGPLALSDSSASNDLTTNSPDHQSLSAIAQFNQAELSLALPATAAVPLASLALLPKLSPRQLRPNDLAELDAEDIEPDRAAIAAADKPSPATRWCDLLPMGIALISLVATVGLWLLVRTKLPLLSQPNSVAAAGDLSAAQQDAEFLNYIRRSLERIDRVSKRTDTLAAAPKTTPTVLDPLFVPLPPPIVMTSPVASAPVASAPAAGVAVSPSPVPGVPVPATAPAVPIAAPAPAPVATPNLLPAVAPPESSSLAPAPTYLLIGLLELGNRSAALFEIDGTPQRIQVGEKFGASGWTLVSVSGEEAIVQRNGDVRSVLIGQKF